MSLADRIKAYTKDKAVQDFSLAMLKVRREKGQSPNNIMAAIIAHNLMQFYNLPIPPPTPKGNNYY